MDPEMMKQIGRKMSILMGISMSLGMSLTGTLSSGHFTVPGFLISFLVSTVVSLIIGFLIPIAKISREACQKRKLPEGSLKARLFESLLSDLIYTPIMTVIMVAIAYFSATRQGAELSYVRMLIPSFFLCFAVGYILIFVLQPFFLKMLIKKVAGQAGRPGNPR